ncbi:MAG: hypothetical protein CMI54_05815 [Parcubacteria group bacterium]|nr:hypothetical protein [Parcubacteria group bacterium]|tara:strand:- start:8338 stop:8598 length:261 start_codon:yes stop_codon:yes gene_type:complete
MNKKFAKKLDTIKESIDWWKEESVAVSFAAEELDYRYEIGELTESELLKKTRELDNRILYLMAKGRFENRALFEAFANHINENKQI